MANNEENVSVQSNDILDNLSIVRTGSKAVAEPGEEISQTITIYNKMDYEMSSIKITDTISSGATFKPRTVTIGGISYGDLNPTSGFNVNVIIPTGNSETITYFVVMDNPKPDGVREVSLSSTVDFQLGRISYSKVSDASKIEFTHGEIDIVKTSDKTAVVKGQKIIYQSVVKNTGTIVDNDVSFKDEIPAGTTFVAGSVKIDNVSYPDYDPTLGFTLGAIDAKSQKVVTFEALVN